MSKRKHYSPEYKRELVELARRSQSSCRQIALEVGIRPWSWICSHSIGAMRVGASAGRTTSSRA